jgi:hypothetical protein
MFPLLPALLLLILRGSTGLERFPQDGLALQPWINLETQIRARDIGSEVAFLELLTLVNAVQCQTTEGPTKPQTAPREAATPIPAFQVASLKRGFQASLRTRDGPDSIG